MKQGNQAGSGSDLSRRLADLSPAKRTLLQQRLQAKGLAFLVNETIRPRETLGPAPLSFSQQRLWFLDRYEPNSAVYNLHSAMRLKGRLNINALRQALEEIVRRHETLRTVFATVEEKPVQVVTPPGSCDLTVMDLVDRSESEREAEAQRLAKEEVRRPFDLAHGPVFRTILIRLNEEDHILVLAMHHIVSDGWSTGVLHRELSVLYRTFAHSQASALPELPVQYSDYAVWQRDWLKGPELERQLSYWKKQLEGMPALLKLPTDRPRPAVQNYRGERRSFELAKELTLELKALSQKQGVTLFMTLLAGFQTLLYRYTGQPDIAVGSPIANRNRSEIEGLIGFFVNTLILRSNFSGDPSVQELLARVREMALGAYAHQDLPFEKLVEELKPERSLTHSPLFQVMFVLQNAPSAAGQLEGLSVSPVRIGSETAKFDLTLFVHEEAERLTASLQYNTDLFDDATIARMSGHYRTLLEAMVAFPDRRLSDLSMLTAAEKHQLLVEWNHTQKDYPREKCLHQLFEEQVGKSPDAAAVMFEDRHWTYRELNARANQMAHYLKKHGVEPEKLVGICLGRSPEILVTLLGILKAGGAYVPLDPDYPEDRLALILEDSKTSLVLTERRFAKLFRRHQPIVQCLEDQWATVGQESRENLVTPVKPENLAYVIYTSGTTGTPKGVLIEHKSLVNYLCWFNQSEIAGAAQVVPLVTRLTFDASLKQLFGFLLRAGQVWILPDEVISEPSLLVKTLGTHSGTALNCVPTLWNALLEVVESRKVSMSNEALSVLLLGGEQFSSSLTDRTRAVFPHLEMWNLYGPTEATSNATAGKIICGRSLALGKPIANVKVVLCDANLQSVPVGVAGELCIGGVGLARGYLGAADLTAEKFIPDPFSEEPGARLYKTGDLARYLPDGNIEFLGRIDNQVKIRGFRIELGEIESTLTHHPGVQGSVAILREDAVGDKRLTAYVVPRQQPPLAAQDLRNFLKQKLPDYMVPSAFVFLNELPLTPNGKLDRNALPAPDQHRPELEAAYLAPRTPVEELLADIWADVLNAGTVGIYDNFFDLGGHSLLAMQVMARIGTTCQVEIPLRLLFENPTVEGLAERVEQIRRQGGEAQSVPLVRGSREMVLPLSFAQQRLWFIDQLEPGTSLYNVAKSMRVRGPLNVPALERSLNEVVRRHEALRTTFSNVDGRPVPIISPSLLLPLSVVDLAVWPESAREGEALRLVNEDAARPFDLARGPLLRALLVRVAPEDHILLLNIHHIVFDGWSTAVLYRELGALYNAFSKGYPATLAELPVQYSDFVREQRKWLQGKVFEEQLGYWKRQLAGLLPLELPGDGQRPAVRTHRGSRRSLLMPKALTEALEELSRRERVTLFMTSLAAFQTLLYRYTGREDIAVGSPIANRRSTKLESLIGFFLNTLVLRTDFQGNPTFKELLGRVRNMTLEAYTHQDLPFENLVEELQPARDLNRNPLFQVLFVLHNNPDVDPNFDELDFSPVQMAHDTAKFDLSLFVTPAEDGLLATVEYSTDLFRGETSERMLVHFQTLLEGIVANPEQRVADLPLWRRSDLDRLLVDWNDTKANYVEEMCVHELFEAQALRAPDAIAAVLGDEQLTYYDLNRRADRLARRLQSFGVGPEARVGLCMERSLEMLVGLLAALKAGGAYVPLDPAYPKERLAFMIEDAQVSVLLSQERLAGNLPEHRARVVHPDKDAEAALNPDTANVGGRATPANLAYVIYTSGSTGKPKAVAMTHGPLSNLIAWQIRNFSQPARATTLQFASLSFDVSFQEMFTTWCSGGTLMLVSEELRRDAAALSRFLREKSVARVFFPVVALQQLAEVASEEPDPYADLREVITAGEQLQITPQIARWLSRQRNCVLHNQYGPSESHVVTAYTLTGAPNDWPALPPIGRPIANAEIFLLDQRLNPVPLGVAGELYIGGRGLARSYLNRPDLTGEKFVPHPFSDNPGERLYRTGDLARYCADGNIEFLGRSDHQVKIRGYRIELGEIEAILNQHPAVRDVVVLAREDEGADPSTALGAAKRLVGYVVPHREGVQASDLRNFLKQKLPDYMVPSAFVLLNELPLTPNGKLDRKALPVPEYNKRELEEDYIAPRTPVEELLVNIWAEVLKVERIGIHDNFFDLGGHSLLATQVMARIGTTCQVEIPLRLLFESPTVAGLAERIEQVHSEGQGLQTLPLCAVSKDRNLPLSFAQERLWFVDQYEPNTSVYNLPSALRLKGPLDVGVLDQSLIEIVHRHESLRTTFSMVDGEPVQVIVPSVEFSLPVVDLRDCPENEREEQARQIANGEFRRPFDLARGPLFRVKLLQLGDDDHVLLLTMHHVVSDGWSMGVFYRELSVLYQAFLNKEPSPLAKLPIQYADFTIWQREWLQGEVLDKQLSYWRKQLEGIPGMPNLPKDRPRPGVEKKGGGRQAFVLSKELTQKLKALNRKEGVTFYMTLLAGFKVLLHQHTGQTDLVIGSPIAGRTRPETEGLIGFFVNTLLLRTDLSGNPSFKELLARVREVALAAYAHQDLPYQKLVETLHPNRDGGRRSLARAFFAFQNIPRQKLEIPGITVTPVRTDLGSAKAALTLFMWEAQDCLAGSLNYAVDVFDAATIGRMLEHFQKLLSELVADPERRLLDLAPILEQSRLELLEAIHSATEHAWHFESDETAGRDQGEI